jgi:hypothetical protein
VSRGPIGFGAFGDKMTFLPVSCAFAVAMGKAPSATPFNNPTTIRDDPGKFILFLSFWVGSTHSMIKSALPSSVAGNSRPSDFAVLRLRVR